MSPSLRGMVVPFAWSITNGTTSDFVMVHGEENEPSVMLAVLTLAP